MSENTYRKQERGGAGVKLVIALTIIFLIGNAGYNYIPVAYQGENFKSELETAVVKGAVMPSRATPLDAVKMRVRGAMVDLIRRAVPMSCSAAAPRWRRRR